MMSANLIVMDTKAIILSVFVFFQLAGHSHQLSAIGSQHWCGVVDIVHCGKVR